MMTAVTTNPTIEDETISNSGTKEAESVVRSLQQLLFPVSPRKASSDSYLCNFLLKTSNAIEFEDEKASQIVRFKDSKEAIAKDLDCASQPARWPTECQVIEEEIVHIPYVPSFPEPFYTPTGKEVQPKPIGDDCGIIVYQYYPISAVNYFSRSSVGGSRYLLPTCPCPEEDCLRFESRFESGNLAKAIKITNSYYELYLRSDMYTSKHTQWFYFRVSKMKKNVLYRFSIVNLSKEGSLYNEGMKLLMYSEKDAQLHSIGWRRCGDNITYFCNDNNLPEESEQQQLYTLTFTVEFPHDDDTCYLAHSYPYTYTNLQNYLQELTTHPVKSTFTNLRLLCKTLAGNNVYYVTITSPQVTAEKKQAIVISARVHPGETPSSWMMKGFLDFLTGDSGPAKELRDKFIFKLVPMLNPDGVIVGNNRCSLTGRDLNRQYRTVIRETYPSIWYTKLMIRRLLEECGVAMYCDLHAHSRRHNIFIYGCENRRGTEKRLHEQVFPLMLHKNAADKFSFENCKFRVQKCKEGTGRVVVWMMGIANSFTMEASFGGSMLAARAETHFGTADYEQMGRAFCQTLLDFYDDDPRKERLRTKIVARLGKEGSNADEPTNIRLSDYSSDSGDSSTTNDEEKLPEEDEDEDHLAEVTLVVPPPSPATDKKPSSRTPKPPRSHPKRKSSPPARLRRPFPMSRASLGVPPGGGGAGECLFTSDVDSSSDTEAEVYRTSKPPPVAKKKKKKKKAAKAKPRPPVHQVLPMPGFDEVEDLEQRKRSVSMFDLLPDTKLKAQSWHRLNVPSIKSYIDNKRNTTAHQLAEVQVKLLSLRNKLWFGVGDSDHLTSSFDWESNAFRISNSAPQHKISPKHSKKKHHHRPDKDKKHKTTSKEHKETSKDKKLRKEKSVSKRQNTIEWIPSTKTDEKVKKLRSITETAVKFHSFLRSANDHAAVKKQTSVDKEESKNKKKKNRSKKKGIDSKLEKTVKNVTNANVFIRKN